MQSLSPGRTAWLVHALIIAALALIASCNDNDGPYAPKPGTSYDPDSGLPLEIVSTKNGVELVLVKAGSFRSGEPRSLAPAVRVAAFYIDKYEVTNKRYYAFTSATGRRAPSLPGDDAILFRWDNGKFAEGRGKYPVVLVTYEDAKAFAEWAGKELPDQEQWEYAARGPASAEFPWGSKTLAISECNTADRLAGRELFSGDMWAEWYTAWATQDARTRNAAALMPVGSFAKDVSPFGCFDMGGNVREWCTKRPGNGDTGDIDSAGSAAATNGPVTCGSSWLKRVVAARAWLYDSVASAPYFDAGFRCVLPVDDPAIQTLARKAKSGE